MNKEAIEHIIDSNYCFVLSGYTYRIRLRVARNDDIKKVEIIWDSWNLLYKGGHIQQMDIAFNDELYSYYQADICNDEPGYAYVFKITDNNDKVYFYSELGLLETYDFNACYLSEFMAVYPNKDDVIVSKHPLDGRLYYQIFPERFNKSSNKKYTSYIDMDWYEEKVRNNKFMGGDLNGIKEKLPYLKELGVGAIYLNPINTSMTAHKYDVEDYFTIDKMFGTLDDLKELVKEAHKLDICIIMDMVFNHVSYNNLLFQDVVKNGKKSKYYNWFFINGDKPNYKKRNYLTFADVPMMPKTNTSNPEVLEYFKKVVTYYVNECDVDGYRLDVAYEVSHKFWYEIKRALVALKPEIIIYGEQWINSASRLSNLEWDSVMNYPFRLAIMNYFKEEHSPASYLSNQLNSLLMRYSDNINHNMINLYDSHDTHRFMDELNFNKDFYLISHALLMFYPGNPEIYYGDEIFEVGQNDPYCRKGMKWNSKEYESNEFAIMKYLLHLRDNQVLRNGEYRVYDKDDLLFIDRFNDKEIMQLIVYKGNSKKEFKVDNIVYSMNFDKQMFNKSGFIIRKINK